jgi:type IV pilus assembly protein PilB
MTRSTGAHWSVAVARSAGWAGAESLEIPDDAGVADAWALVMSDCGVSEAVLTSAISGALRCPLARWETAQPTATTLVPERLARRHHVFPLSEDYKRIVIATADPTNLSAEQDIAFSAGRQVSFVLASPSAIAVALDASYAPQSSAESLLAAAGDDLTDAVQVAESAGPESIRAEDALSTPVVSLANLLIRDGVRSRASDIHVEPGRTEGVVRFRVDGVMRDYLKLPMPVFNRVVSRLKILGKMDIADRMRPQDGRSRVILGSKTVDLRISTVPTRESEKAVIRILDTLSTRRLDEIGFPTPEMTRLRRLLAHRDGIMVVTGPTGSGKTTTLYGAIQEIASGEVNVVTIEDPVEYEVARITQVQIEPKRGVTFANTLRSVLRQDPDVIFVGEVRDAETAETAAHAAMTGHLVLTTLHTNDAIGVLQRLVDLGLDRSTIASCLRGAIAQRLVRRLCPTCRVPATAPFTADETRLARLAGQPPVQRAVGCEACGGTGYLGRLAVAEVLVVTAEIARQLAEGLPLTTIARTAIAEGMRPMASVGLDAVRSGETTLSEIDRIIGFDEPESGGPEASAPADVLLVDDDPLIRAMASATVALDQLTTTEASSGEEAIEMLVGEKAGPLPRLVLLDLGLPGMDGRAVVRALRAAPRTQRLPIVILTGSQDEADELALMEDGVDDYLRKPIDPARLRARCRAVLRRSTVT